MHTADQKRSTFSRIGIFACTAMALWLYGSLTQAGEVAAQFTKSFLSDPIGPGSSSTLQFTISNFSGSPIGDLAFTDTLPSGVFIATPAAVVNDCGGTVNAPDGGGTISFGGGSMPDGGNCNISVNVTSRIIGSHVSTSGNLTSDQGTHGTATDTLNVQDDRPGFSKRFGGGLTTSCTTVPTADRAALTKPRSGAEPGKPTPLLFLIDNSCNSGDEFDMNFIDNLPAGMVVADPPNRFNDCGGTLNAEPGASSISLGFGAVDAGDTCTIGVDVVTETAGRFENVTSDLRFSISQEIAGKAGDVLEVVQPVFSKAFTDDPVNAGDTVTLDFTIRNLDREFAMTDIAFSDDLDATLSGLEAIGANANTCGGMAGGFPTGLFDYAGGNLAPGESCTISLTLQVPDGADPGSYPNTTSTLTGTRNGDGFAENPAQDVLLVSPLRLNKAISPDPVAAGDDITLLFTLSNNDAANSISAISFTDNLSAFLPSHTVVSLPASGPGVGCGSSFSIFTATVLDDVLLIVDGAELGADSSCAFDVVLKVNPDTSNGTYTNRTNRVTGRINGTTPTSGNIATDEVTVVGSPVLQKEFIGDPAQPGGTATLQFRLLHDEFAPGTASSIGFTDNLNTVIGGLTAVGLPLNDICGSGSQIEGTSLLTFSGGLLDPGSTCVFDIPLQIPANAPSGSFTNTTSEVTAQVSGLAVTGAAASADLMVSGIQFSKAFTDDPALPGGQVTLEFTITNLDATAAATDIRFDDDIDAVVDGMTVADTLPLNDICGTGSSLDLSAFATQTLEFRGGSLDPATGEGGTACTFSVTLDVPGAAEDNSYLNVTSDLLSSQGTAPPATDTLLVDSDLLVLQKEFTDDPVVPGGTVTLQFTITTQDETNPAADIAFTDDLTNGLTVSGVPASDCGGTLTAPDGGNSIALSGGSLAAGGECTIVVAIDVPAGTPVDPPIENVTSAITGTINGLSVSGGPGVDTLQLRLLSFSKSFVDDPAEAGGTVTLSFTLRNESASETVSGISFNDDLAAVTPGLAATNTPRNDICGTGSSLAGTSTLLFQDGELGPGASCTFTVRLAVPADARGDLLNTTSAAMASGSEIAPPASDTLTVLSPPTVSFTVASASIPESAGGPATVVGVVLSRASALPVTVPFSTGGTASPTADYQLITVSPITIPAGATTATVSGRILEDTLVEGNETIIVTMGTPTNAQPGAINQFTGTIVDNDSAKTAAGTTSSDEKDDDSCDSIGEYLLLCIGSTGPEDFVVLIPLALIGLARRRGMLARR